MVVRAVPVQVGTMHRRPVHPPPVIPVLGQTLGIPTVPPAGAAPQRRPMGQDTPQSSARPQPSPMTPQYWPPVATMQLIGLQPGSPQTPGTPPPPQVAGAVQAPQSIAPPQPSPITPQ